MWKVFQALIDLRQPVQACLCMSIGSQAAWWLVLPRDLWWWPQVCLLAALVWAGIAWPLFRQRCPISGGFNGLCATLTQAAGIPSPSSNRFLAITVLLLGVLGAPWWPAAVLWAAFIFLCVLYPKWGKRSVYAVELIAATLGLFAVAIGALSERPTTWLDVGAALCAMAAVGAIVAAIILRSRERPIQILQLGWVLPSFLPFCVIFWPGLLGILALSTVGLVIWPAALLLVVLFRHQVATEKCHTLLENKQISEVLGKKPAGIREDDTVRENDEYCRVCYPEFLHWSARLTGETGYLTWIGGTNDRVVSEDCVVFRTTGLAPASFALTQDSRGRALSILARDLIPDLGLDEVRPLRQAFYEAWSVKRLPPKKEIFVAKMPWDHPYLLAIPVNWNGRFIYPAGCGIHDSDGYPCHARKVDVHISLTPSVLAAVDRISGIATSQADRTAQTEDLELCRKLLWNAWRILPAAYETLLTCIVRQFRACSVSLFVGRNGGFQGGDGEPTLESTKAEFLDELNKVWPTYLPEPLQELARVTVRDIELDTYYAEDARTKLFELQQLEKERPYRLLHDLAQTREELRQFVFEGNPRTDRPEERVLLSARVTNARRKIIDAVSGAINEVSQLKGADRMMGTFPGVQEKLVDCGRAFEGEINERFELIQAALDGLKKVYESPKDAQSQ